FGKTVLSHVQGSTFSLPDLLEKAFRISASFLAGVAIAIVAGAFLAGALRLWTLGQFMEMALVGAMVGVAVWLIGLPSPYALGAIAGVTQFVPYLGPIVGMIPAMLVATTVSGTALLWTLFAYLLIHQFDGYVIMPVIQRRMVSVPPALMLLSIVALGE